MKIAKIVSSNSHIAYVARVLDTRDGGVKMNYFPSLMSHSGPLSLTLAMTMMDQLGPLFSDFDRQKLAVMRSSLSWKHTFGDNRY